MEMAYRERWQAEIAEMQRALARLGMTEERKWGKPTYKATPAIFEGRGFLERR